MDIHRRRHSDRRPGSVHPRSRIRTLSPRFGRARPVRGLRNAPQLTARTPRPHSLQAQRLPGARQRSQIPFSCRQCGADQHRDQCEPQSAVRHHAHRQLRSGCGGHQDTCGWPGHANDPRGATEGVPRQGPLRQLLRQRMRRGWSRPAGESHSRGVRGQLDRRRHRQRLRRGVPDNQQASGRPWPRSRTRSS